MRLFAVIWALLVALATPLAAQGLNGLVSFASETELRTFLAEQSGQEPECPPEWEVCPGYRPGEYVIITGSRVPAPPITNNQEAGVDEGDFVKLHGDTLVVLRRGRLFTVDISQGALRPVDSIAAYPPGVDAEDDWYDEILVSDGWVVVVGYSYERETTEINRFRLDAQGRLTFVDSHRLAAQDYYSSRNYTSRLVGERLLIYSPVSLEEDHEPLAHLPRLSRVRPGRTDHQMSLFRPDRIYLTPSPIENAPLAVETIHGLVECDLTARVFSCQGTAFIGPSQRILYVSRDAAYLWLGQSQWDDFDNLIASGSILYRLPFDGSQPLMAGTIGFPGDQLSFAEDTAAGILNVLVLLEGAEVDGLTVPAGQHAVGLLRLPLFRFELTLNRAVSGDYRLLSVLPNNSSYFRNQMLDTHAVYAVSTGGQSGAAILTAAAIEGGPAASWLVEGWVERVERAGDDAVIVARSESGVEFLTLDLVADAADREWDAVPQIRGTYLLESARGAETRSHAFYYQPALANPDGEFGILGLPVVRDFDRDNPLFDQAADVIFIRRGHDQLSPLGTLNSQPEAQADDACVSSCVDWYGDARPIFIGDRIFALLGYELVEGRPEGRTIREVQRVSFAPRLSDQ